MLWPPGVGWGPCCQVERKPCGPPGALRSHQVLRVTPGRTRGPLPGAEVSLGTKAEGGAEAPLRAPQTPVVCLCMEAEPTRRPGCVLNSQHPVLQPGRAGPALLTSWPRRRLLPHLPSWNPALCTPGSGLCSTAWRHRCPFATAPDSPGPVPWGTARALRTLPRAGLQALRQRTFPAALRGVATLVRLPSSQAPC